MRISVWGLQLQAIRVPIMFRFVTATPFDLNTPLGQRHAIIRRSGEDVEMVEAAWGLRPGPGSGRPVTLVRGEGRAFPTHRCLVPVSEFRLPTADARTAFHSPTTTGSIWPVSGGQRLRTGPNPMRS